MPNIRVKARLESLADELQTVLQHVVQHSGVSPKEAVAIDNRCCEIAESAARIAAVAREASGNRTAETVVRNVRRSLGYTNP
jgi:hypothetical protein